MIYLLSENSGKSEMIKVQEPVKLFQYNTLGALMAGLYGGTMTVGELLEHGDLGARNLRTLLMGS